MDREKPIRIICFGDSNTYGYDPRSYFGSRYDAPWPEQLAHLTGWSVVNAGANGRTIPRQAYDIHLVHELYARQPINCFIVMLGTNDLLQGADAETVTSRMEHFLTGLSLSSKQLFLVAPPPMRAGEWVTEERLLRTSQALAEHYKRLAKTLDIGFADAGEWSIDLTFDGVHFTEEGHRAFVDGISRSMKNYI